jgi:aarF domain-containing kinase
VHAHQIFVDGVYNTDPHAGNVIAMSDGRLGLIDYGGAAELGNKERGALARLLLAIAGRDEGATIRSMNELGFRTESNDRQYMLSYAYICFHKGYADMEAFYSLGVPRTVGVSDLELYLNGRDKLLECPAHLAQVQRCVMVLLGLSAEMGAQGLSIAELWKGHAERYLRDKEE